jgi:cytidine deaminase
MIELSDPEDVKIVALARSARARTRAAEGACVRDTDGRTYAAATVDLKSLKLSAVQVAVAMAASSGAQSLEAVAVLGESTATNETDLAVVRDFTGPGVTFLVASSDGSVLESVAT